MKENFAPLHVLLVVIAAACFLFAAFTWFAPIEPYRIRLVAAGLFFWIASTLL